MQGYRLTMACYLGLDGKGLAVSQIKKEHEKMATCGWLVENGNRTEHIRFSRERKSLGDQRYRFSKHASKEEDLTGANRIENKQARTRRRRRKV